MMFDQRVLTFSACLKYSSSWNGKFQIEFHQIYSKLIFKTPLFLPFSAHLPREVRYRRQVVFKDEISVLTELSPLVPVVDRAYAKTVTSLNVAYFWPN